MVKDLTKFHKRHLGGRGMLACVQVSCFFGGGEELQSSVLTWRGCIAHNNQRGRGHAPTDFFNFFYLLML